MTSERTALLIEVLADHLSQEGELCVAAPGDGPGYWAGGPSAVWRDGAFWLAYRLRRPVDAGRGYANVVARSLDGVSFETVAVVERDTFECGSLERPALAPRPDGGWRLYVSCSTIGSKHWWVEALDADRPDHLAGGRRTVVLPGDSATAWKDPVVMAPPGASDQWSMWVCRHRITDPNQADAMDSWYATSPDGLVWELQGPALAGRPGEWDARGARISSVLAVNGGYEAFYDGRATADENWEERTGLAYGSDPAAVVAVGTSPIRSQGSLRYLSVVEVPGGGWRFYYELARSDGAHDLRTEYVPRPSALSQSA